MRAYEQKITDLGGLDIQILGIGRTGHIGFNEPGSAPNSGTRVVTLDDLTRRDASRDFGVKRMYHVRQLRWVLVLFSKLEKLF